MRYVRTQLSCQGCQTFVGQNLRMVKDSWTGDIKAFCPRCINVLTKSVRGISDRFQVVTLDSPEN